MRTGIILLLLVFFNASCVHAGNAGGDPQELGYYQNMSALAFVYVAELFEKEKNADEQMRIARDVSYIMFTYWAQSRMGTLKPSRKVDVAVQKTYKIHFAQKQALEQARVFEDPIGWLETARPATTPPLALESIDRAQYKALLPQYYAFLGISKAEGVGPQDTKGFDKRQIASVTNRAGSATSDAGSLPAAGRRDK